MDLLGGREAEIIDFDVSDEWMMHLGDIWDSGKGMVRMGRNRCLYFRD